MSNRQITWAIFVAAFFSVGCTRPHGPDTRAENRIGAGEDAQALYLREVKPVIDIVEADPRFIAAKRRALDHIAETARRLTFADPSAEVVAKAVMSEARTDLDNMYSIGGEIASSAGRRSPYSRAYREEYERGTERTVVAGILERRAAAPK